MQMENRMEKTPEVVCFPIQEDLPLTDCAAIDKTTENRASGCLSHNRPSGKQGPRKFRGPCFTLCVQPSYASAAAGSSAGSADSASTGSGSSSKRW